MSSIPQLSGRHRRLVWLAVVWLGCGLILVVRLVWWQLFPHPDLRLYGGPGPSGVRTIPAVRGNILDSNGHYLAVSTIRYKVGVSPDLVWPKLREPLAADAARLLNLSEDDVREVLAVEGETYVALETTKFYTLKQTQQLVDIERAHKVLALETAPTPVPHEKALELAGESPTAFDFESKYVREYPDGSLAASVLGFVRSWDGDGNYGLEQYYDRELRGVAGTWEGLDDAWGVQISLNTDGYRPPTHGADLVLTLDRNVQAMAEKILLEGIEDAKASSGNIIVLDPKTGAILAMANWPTYSPAEYGKVKSSDQYVNTAISWTYEPGSVFKPLTLAAALEARMIRPTDTYDDRGEIIVGNARIRNADKKAHGRTNMTQLLAYSLNVGAAHVATLLGPTRFYERIRHFGFSENTGVDLALEVPGSMRVPGTSLWHMSDLGTNSFGQGILVTPLQVAAAFGALANDGNLMRPYVVAQYNFGGTSVVKKPMLVRQVISQETAKQITQLMADAVELALREPLVPGYRFAAKSGTSQIPEQEGYQDKDVVASFVGYGPLPDPRFVILVKYDKPREGYWGSEVAAPAFGKMARYLVRYYGIAPLQQARAESSR